MSGLRVAAALALVLVLALGLPQRAAGVPTVGINTDIATTQLCYTAGTPSAWTIVFTDTYTATATVTFSLGGTAVCAPTFTCPAGCNSAMAGCATHTMVAGDDAKTIQATLTDPTPNSVIGMTQTVHVISISSVNANGVVGTGPYYAVMDAASSANTITVMGTFNSATFNDGSTSHNGPMTTSTSNTATYGPLTYAPVDDQKSVTITVSNSNCVAGNQPTVMATVNLVYLTFASFTTSNPAPIGAANSVVLKATAAAPIFTVGMGTGYNQVTLTETAAGAIGAPGLTIACPFAIGCTNSATTFTAADDGHTVAATIKFATGGTTSTVTQGTPTSGTGSVTIVFLSFASFTTTNPAPMGASRSVVLKTGAATPTFTVGAGTGYNQFTLTETPAGGTISTPLVTTGCSAAAGCMSSATAFAAADDGKTISVTIGFATGGTTSTVTQGTPTSGTGSVTIVFLSFASFTTTNPAPMGASRSVVLKTGAATPTFTVGAGTGYNQFTLTETPAGGTISTPLVTTGCSAAAGCMSSATAFAAADDGKTISVTIGFATGGTTSTVTEGTPTSGTASVTIVFLSVTMFTTSPALSVCGATSSPCTPGTSYLITSGAGSVSFTFVGTGFDTAQVSYGATTLMTTGVATGITVSATLTGANSGQMATPLLWNSVNSAIKINTMPMTVTLIYLSAPTLPVVNADNSMTFGAAGPTQIVVATYGLGLTNYLNPTITVSGTGFDSAQLVDLQNGGAQVTSSTCTVTNGGTPTAMVTCYPHGMGSALTISDDNQLWAVKLWHSANPANSIMSNSIRMVVFGIKTQPTNQLLFSTATGANQGSATFTVVTQGGQGSAGGYSPSIALLWMQKQFTGSSFSAVLPASVQAQTSIVVTSDGMTPNIPGTPPASQVVGQNQDIFKVTLTLNTVVVTSSTASLQVMIGSYPGTSGKLNTNYASTTSNLFTYDYYSGGAPWLSNPTSEPQYQQQYQVTNVYALDSSGAIQTGMFPSTCTLVLKNGAGVQVSSIAINVANTMGGGSGTVTGTYTIAAGPSDPPLSTTYTTYDFVTQLNGGYLEVDCTPVGTFVQAVLGGPQNPPALNIRYPPKVSPELPGLPPFTPINRYSIGGTKIYRWAATPSSFGNTGYPNFPEPGAFLLISSRRNQSINPPSSLTLSLLID